MTYFVKFNFPAMSISILKMKKWIIIMPTLIFILVVVLAVRYSLERYLAWSLRPYHLNRTSWPETITCHFETEGDALPSADELNPAENSIFFHETSCLGGLDSRQACSIEAVARIHPDRSIYVLFSAPVPHIIMSRSSISRLSQFKNIHFARVHAANYAKETPLYGIIANNLNNLSDWQVEHTSDLLRYITIYKYGGVYLDMDMLIVKNLTELGSNWVGREGMNTLSVAAFSMDKKGIGYAVATTIINELEWNFQPHIWRHNGPGAMNRALATFCLEKTKIKLTNTSNFSCQGFTVYNPTIFYPVHYKNASMYFKKGNLSSNSSLTFGYHTWNRLSRNMTIEWDSPFDKLSRQYCPTVREFYGELFGL